MTIKLHRCPFTWPNGGRCHCTPVQRALDRAGIEYEIVKEPSLPRSRRTRVQELSGQLYLPIIEFSDGRIYRDESHAMAEQIEAGALMTPQ